MLNNQTVMTIFAHPDDETFSAGGVLAKYEDSYAVSITLDPKRVTEFKTACELLSTNPIQLEYNEISPKTFNEIKNELISIIRKYKPTHVITHIDFDYHQEHRTTRAIVEEAVEWASHTTTQGVEAHQVSSLWAAETTVMIPSPHIFIDISDFNTRRLDAIKVYESQSHKGGEGFYSKFHNARTSLRGIQAGVEHAEAFMEVPLIQTGSFKPVKYLEYFP